MIFHSYTHGQSSTFSYCSSWTQQVLFQQDYYSAMHLLFSTTFVFTGSPDFPSFTTWHLSTNLFLVSNWSPCQVKHKPFIKWPDGPVNITVISITYTLLSLSINISSSFLTSCTPKPGMNIIWPSSDPFPSFFDIFNCCNSLSKNYCNSTQQHRLFLKKYSNFLNGTQKKHSPSFSLICQSAFSTSWENSDHQNPDFLQKSWQKCNWEGICISWWSFPKKEQNHWSSTLNCSKNLREEGTMGWWSARVSLQKLYKLQIK